MNFLTMIEEKLGLNMLPTKQRIMLYRQLKRMLKISPLKESLQEIALRAKQNKGGKQRAAACELMIEGLKNNRPMGQTLQGLVPPSECIILNVGERNGRLTESLDALLFLLETQKGVVQSLVKATTYPAVLFIITLGMYIGFKVEMLPILESVVSSDKWSDTTLLVSSIADFIAQYWLFIIILFFGSGYAVYYSLPNWTHSEIRRMLDQYPLYGTYRDLQSSTFILALSSMQRAGAPLDASIKQIRELSTPWMRQHLDNMLWKLRKVSSAGDALDVGMIPGELMADIKIATKSGDLDEALEELGREAIIEFKDKINLLANMIMPVGILCVAINIILIGLAYYGAIMPEQ